MKKRIILLFIIALVLAVSFSAVLAQESPYSLRLTRVWGYGNGVDINGRMSLTVKGNQPQIQEVTFLMDGLIIGVVGTSPFKLEFDTNDFDPGIHRLTAEVKTTAGETHTTDALASNFVEKEAANQSLLRTLLIVGGIVLASIGLQLLMQKNSKKTVKVDENGHIQYGAFGGTICPNCGQTFQRSPIGINLGGRRLQTCPHCGKLVAVRRASSQELEAAERRFTPEAEELTAVQIDHQDKQESYDDSKYTDL